MFNIIVIGNNIRETQACNDTRCKGVLEAALLEQRDTHQTSQT
jgi:hypothetical protein